MTQVGFIVSCNILSLCSIQMAFKPLFNVLKLILITYYTSVTNTDTSWVI